MAALRIDVDRRRPRPWPDGSRPGRLRRLARRLPVGGAPARWGSASAVAAVAMTAAAVALATERPSALLPLAVLPLPAVRYLRGSAALAALVLVAAGVVGGGLHVASAGSVAALCLLAVAAAGAGTLWRREVAGLTARLRLAELRAAAVGVHDELTGCANHHGLLLLGGQVLQGTRRRSDSAHALIVEVGSLEPVRRSMGPAAGDLVVCAVADALCHSTRATDVVARWSPETFAVVGPGSGATAAEIERRVRIRLLDEPPVPPSLWPCHLTAGAGVLEPWDAGTLTDLLHRAGQDLSLRRALRAPSAPEPPGRR